MSDKTNQDATESGDSSTDQLALWTPGWYELDQSVAVGIRQRFWFYQSPPVDEKFADQPIGLVFYNQMASNATCQVRFATITEIVHSTLGQIMRVDTDGLDYIFYPVEGDEVIVNAEEEPGSVIDSKIAVDDWSLLIKLSDVSEPVADLV